ncbi:MAG: flagellar basal-body MS-ring/collar protein FliF [Rubrivivax sp.]|nr:flagellar basal-body MS-ring/collar protein FliF [Rubrivivax sp.]
MAPPGLGARMAALPVRAKLMAAVGIAALLAVLVAMSTGVRQGDYKVLFANLSEKDGGPIIERLAQMNVPYRFTEGGGAILVPANKVYDLRLKLSAAGLPKGSVNGYELLDKTPFGQTQGQERINLQRALEGELTRTIQSLDSVQAARVHLALPNQNGFFREQQKPSASVVLSLHPGRTLERGQIAGIVHLVSSSVPELNAKAVSVLDGSGALLSSRNDGSAQGLDSQQLQYLREVEASHLKRVIELIEPVVGRDNLRATVSAELDFSQTEALSEAFKPNQGNEPATIRALRSEESSQPGANGAGGVPGATTNQPPVPATAPINGAAPPLQGAPAGQAGNGGRREAETRYEVDKTTRWTRGASGSVRRVNAAVVVNHRISTDAKGKTVSTPLSAEELENLTALVRQGIGFNQERGDSVRVINAPFRIEAPIPVEETPIWKQVWVQDLLRAGMAPAALALVALVIIGSLIKPALKAAMAVPTPPPGAQLSEMVADDAALPVLPAPEPTPMLSATALADANLKLTAVRTMAKDNPAAVANIVRGWVNGEAG